MTSNLREMIDTLSGAVNPERYMDVENTTEYVRWNLPNGHVIRMFAWQYDICTTSYNDSVFHERKGDRNETIVSIRGPGEITQWARGEINLT